MLVAESVAEVRSAVAAARAAGKSVGFVPTMGALHAGHRSLMEASRSECDFHIVSIFVNPTQFGPHEDLAKYPRPRDADLELCRSAGMDVVFYPPVDAMYPPGYRTFVEVEGLSSILEGAIRPGHFRGVATVVTKLLLIAGADRAYFGQKDYQQQTLIRVMVAELNLPTEIRVCPTLRDPDGLAMSSRNAYLTAEQRQAGLSLSRALSGASERIAAGETSVAAVEQAMHDVLTATPGVVIDYAVLRHPDTLAEIPNVLPRTVALIAAKVGTTRLIDNIVIDQR